jgi:hypothetical protein
VIAQRFMAPAPSVRVDRRDVPEYADRALRRAMALEPAQRFPATIDFVRAMGIASAGTPPGGVAAIEEAPAPAPAEPPRPSGPGPKARLALFGLALVLVAALAVFAALKLVSGR